MRELDAERLHLDEEVLNVDDLVPDEGDDVDFAFVRADGKVWEFQCDTASVALVKRAPEGVRACTCVRGRYVRAGRRRHPHRWIGKEHALHAIGSRIQ